LILEWTIMGLSPLSNRAANPFLMLGLQPSMFAFWATVATAPRAFLDPSAPGRYARRRILRFNIPYFAMVYVVGLSIQQRWRFGTIIPLIVVGYSVVAGIVFRWAIAIYYRDIRIPSGYRMAPRLPPWSRAARTSPPTSLEPSEIGNTYDCHYANQLLHNMQNKDWQRRDVRVRVGLIAVQVTGASCTRGSWDPFTPQPDLWAQKAGHLFLTSLALLMLEVYHRSFLVYRPIDTDPVLPAAVTDDDERKADDEPDVDAPAPSPEARPNRAAPVLQPCAVKTCG
jgi:hypothetical protein